MRKVGGGWINTSQKTGTKYISVKMDDGKKYLIFKTKEKKNEKSPDYTVNDPDLEPEAQTKKWVSETETEDFPF